MDAARAPQALVLLALAGAGALWIFTRTQRGAELASTVLEEIIVTAKKIAAWSPPRAADAFRAFFDRARGLHGLPELLLERVAYQESRFRADIIDGRTVSPAGALGIMQIVPRWHPGVDPLNPPAAIDYAGKYLRQLYGRFGTWQLALAAYNWGQGNVSNALRDSRAFATWPVETQQYVRQIAADVPALAGEERLA